MKKVFIALLLTTLVGCFGIPDVPQKAPPEPEEPTNIEGLELKFQEIGIGLGCTSITFTNPSTGFITTIDGRIIRTTDGGNTWTDLKVENYVALNDIYFLNESEGWVAGGTIMCFTSKCTPRGAVILHTTDGGTTWSEIKMDLTKRIELAAIWFINSNTGFAVGDNMIIKTTDGGNTWKETLLDLDVSVGLTANLVDVSFMDTQHGIAGASVGRIATTEDGGATWLLTAPFKEEGYTAVSLAVDNIIYGCGQSKMFRSTDYGKTWSQLPTYPTPVRKLAFVSQQTGFVFGMGDYIEGPQSKVLGSIFYTTDGGQSWKGASDVHEMSTITSASFPTESVGFAVSSYKLVRITLK